MTRSALLVLSFSLFALAACSRDEAGAPPAPPPAEVAFVTVTSRAVPLVTELPGRLEASRIAEVRARAAGIVLERTFEEGSDVTQGQVLFRIDPAPLQAALRQAEATLARAQADVVRAQRLAERSGSLVETGAISRQQFDEAIAGRGQAEAMVKEARAAVDTARLNLDYANVTAPIAGRIGRALVTEGALVGQGEATPLATIQQIDPIYVNITQSSSDLLELQRALATGSVADPASSGAQVALTLPDGSAYPHRGELLFTDLAVEPTTGAVSLRALFPNPEKRLLPGLYVRAELAQAVDRASLTVPQQAVQRTPEGATVLVIGAGDKLEARPVEVGASVGNESVITSGLNDGERVVVEGFQKIAPGAVVRAVAWKPTPADGAAAANAPAATPSDGTATSPRAGTAG